MKCNVVTLHKCSRVSSKITEGIATASADEKSTKLEVATTWWSIHLLVTHEGRLIKPELLQINTVHRSRANQFPLHQRLLTTVHAHAQLGYKLLHHLCSRVYGQRR